MVTTTQQLSFTPEPGEYALVPLADLPSDEEMGGLEPTKDFIASLHHYGLLSPVRLARTPEGTLRVIYGRRRVKASRALGWESVPALVVPASENEGMISLQENIARAADQRQEIRVILDLAARGASLQEIRAILPGRTVGQIKKILKLGSLTPALQAAVLEGSMLVSAAYAAADLKQPQQHKLEALLADPKKVIGPSDVEPLKRVQSKAAQQQCEDIFTLDVPSADEVAQAAGQWQTRALATLRDLLHTVPEDHPAYEALEQVIGVLGESDALR